MKICTRLLIGFVMITCATPTANPMNFADGVKKIRQLQEEKKQEALKLEKLKSMPGVTPKLKRMLDITMRRKNDKRNQEARSLIAKNVMTAEEIRAVKDVVELDTQYKARTTTTNEKSYGKITQIRCLIQTHEPLKYLSKLGYDSNGPSKLYAIHNAKIFDYYNYRDMSENLADQFNDRNKFEEKTLIPNITKKAGTYRPSEFIDNYENRQIVVCLKDPKELNFCSEGDKLKINSFINKLTAQITLMLNPKNDKHWFVAHIIRNEDGKLEAIIADSKGQNRSDDANVKDLMEYLKA